MSVLKKAVLIAALAGLAAPLWAGQKYDVEVTVRERKVVNPTLQGLTLVLNLNLKNLSSSALSLVKYDYQLVIEKIPYLNIQTTMDEPILIEPRGETPIALPIKITYAYVFAEVPYVSDEAQVACTLTGGMVFADERRREKRIPIAFSGDFPIYQGLDVRILPIEAKDLTVGGADLVVKAALKNLNGFSFTLDRFDYSLDIAGKTVLEGNLGQGTAVAGRAEKVFAVPLLLDFFDAGKELYDGLSQPPVPVRISGTAEIATSWGTFKIPFDKRERIPVQKIS